MTFVVDPRILKTSSELQGYPVDERKCYFSDERRLKYFKQYTQNTCEVECEIDLVLKNCGCYLIIVEARDNIDVCGPRHQSCTFVTGNALHLENFLSCKCLPACSVVSYDSVMSTTKFNISDSLSDHRIDREE
jgi:acid-sensing ion channel, other